MLVLLGVETAVIGEVQVSVTIFNSDFTFMPPPGICKKKKHIRKRKKDEQTDRLKEGRKDKHKIELRNKESQPV